MSRIRRVLPGRPGRRHTFRGEAAPCQRVSEAPRSDGRGTSESSSLVSSATPSPRRMRRGTVLPAADVRWFSLTRGVDHGIDDAGSRRHLRPTAATPLVSPRLRCAARGGACSGWRVDGPRCRSAWFARIPRRRGSVLGARRIHGDEHRRADSRVGRRRCLTRNGHRRVPDESSRRCATRRRQRCRERAELVDNGLRRSRRGDPQRFRRSRDDRQPDLRPRRLPRLLHHGSHRHGHARRRQ